MTGLCDGKSNCSDGSDEQHSPAKIFIKTTAFNKNAVSNLAALKTAMTKPSPKGYCEKTSVTYMTTVSNRRLCGGSTNKNIGFWYKVTFTVGQDGDKYAF